MRKHEPTILAVDPGLRDLGFAVLRGRELLGHGVLSFRHLPASQRLKAARQELERVIRAHEPSELVLENMPKRPLDAFVGLPALGRLLRRLAKLHHLNVTTHSAKTVRRAIVGNGWAGKLEVAKVLMARFPQLKVYRGQLRKWQDRYWGNMFDALALGIHHQQSSD